jgi:hypothetical protein
MLAFDAFVFWKASGQMPTKGTIIHGLQHTALGFKLDAWIHEVESLVGKLRALLTDGSPPDPVLIKHCSECVFEAPCRKKVTGARAVSPGGTKRHAQHPPLDFRVTIRLGRFADELIQSNNAQVNPPMRLPKGNKGPVYSTVYEFLSPEHVIKEFIDKW